MEAIVTGIDRR